MKTKALLIALVIGMVGTGAPQSASPPLSPGSVLLLSGKDDAGNIEVLRRALRDTDPEVRAASARVAAVSTSSALNTDLVSALAREQSAPAAAELLRALLLRTGAGALSVADSQIRRIGAPAVLVTADWMARMQPDALPGRLADFVSIAGASAYRLGPIVAFAATVHSGDADALLRAWLDVAPERAWFETLRIVLDGEPAVRALTPVLVAALESPRASVRADTAWSLVRAASFDIKLPDAVLAAGPPAGADVSDWEALGRGWMQRSKNASADADRSAAIEAAFKTHRDVLDGLRQFPKLKPAEERIVRDAVKDVPARWPVLAPRTAARSLDPVSPRSLRSAIAASGCQTSDRLAGRADVNFTKDGRPSHIELYISDLAADCQTLIAALIRTSLASPEQMAVPSAPQTLIVPLTDAFADCAGDEEWDTTASDVKAHSSNASSLKSPKKVRDVTPFYPDAAKHQRIQGVIIVRAHVTATGCVRAAEVIRDIPYLGVPALIAVSGWKYEPAMLDGKPVPAEMIAVINFELP